MSAARVATFFRFQLLIYARSKTPLFLSLIFPIMMTFIFGSIQSKDYLLTIIPGLVGFSILTDSLFTVTSMTSKYRLMNIFSQLSLTPLKKSEWLISVFAWHLIIAFLSLFIIVGIGHFAYGVSLTLNFWVPLFVITGSLLFVSLGLLIGSVAKSVESSGLASNIIGFPMMMLAGTFFPVAFLPWFLQDFVKVLPLFYFVQGLNDVTVTASWSEGILYLGILVVLSVVFFAAATRMFKWREA